MPPKEKLYIFAGGGSGGHLYPGISVAQCILEQDPTAKIVFYTTNRQIDKEILSKHSYDQVVQPVLPMKKSVGGMIKFYRNWLKSIWNIRELFVNEMPAVVLGLGGFASAPAMKVAHEKGIPVAMLNPDAIPGKANRYAAKFSDKIFLQWSTTSESFDGKYKENCLATGCPIRSNLFTGEPRKAYKMLGLNPAKKTLVVMGGSQGGRNVNEAFVLCIEEILSQPVLAEKLSEWQVVHLTGEDDQDWVKQNYRQCKFPAQVIAYTEKMWVVLMCADLVVARSGASTLAELTSKKLPSILIPYPYHKDQHQLRNAEILERTNASIIVKDQKDAAKTAPCLEAALLSCLDDDQRAKMATGSAEIAKPNAAMTVAQELIIMANQ